MADIPTMLRPGDAGYQQVASAFSKGRVSAMMPLPQNAYAFGYKWQLVEDSDEIRFARVGAGGEGVGTYTGHSFDANAGAALTTQTAPKTTGTKKTVKTEK